MHLAYLGVFARERLDGALVDMHAEVLFVDRGVESALVHVVFDHIDLAIGGGALLGSLGAREEPVELLDPLQRRVDLRCLHRIVAVFGERVDNLGSTA